jgi:GTP pyrophosphokinase
VTIHRSDCPSLVRMRATKPERVLKVEWAATNGGSPSVELSVSAYDRRGLVRDITDVLAFERLSIEAMTTTTDRGAGTAHVLVTVTIGDVEQLVRLLKRLAAVPNVIHARRLH